MNKDIKTLFFSSDLTDRTCRECNNFFTLLDYSNDNWEINTKGNIDLNDFKTGTSKGKIRLLIELYHKECVEKEEKHPPRQDFNI